VKIALFVEGPSDKETIPILIRKIFEQNIGIITRVARNRGDLLNTRKVLAHIHGILRRNQADFKVIVCVDSHCTPKAETEKEAVEAEKSIRSEVSVPVHYAPVIHALEGWLMSDHDAIRRCVGANARVSVGQSDITNCRPKEIMKAIFRRNGRDFLPRRDCPKIARETDIERLTRLNESFREFRERVEDP